MVIFQLVWQKHEHGNIWIRGAGDVSLGSKYFNTAGHEFDFLLQWADTLISLGIKGVEGSIIADGSEFGYNGAPKGWASNDLGNYYGATHAGINFYDNTIKLFFLTSSNISIKYLNNLTLKIFWWI